MAELDTLGTPGRPGGVDDGGQGLRGQGRAAPVELAGIHASTGLDEPQDVLALDAQHLQALELGYGGGQCADHGGHGLVLHDDEPDAGVGEDPLGLLGRGGLVDGDDDEARLPGGEVQQRPLIRRVRHDADGVSGLKTSGHQARGHLTHLGAEGTGAHLPPTPPQGGLAGDEPAVGTAAHALGQRPGRRHAVVNRDQELGGVLLGRGRGAEVGRSGGGVGHDGKYARPRPPARFAPVYSCGPLRVEL